MSDQPSANPSQKLWGGRFTESQDAFVEEFNASVGFDQRLYAHDFQGSIAHATMLSRVGVLTDAEAATIVDGLNGIRADIEAGNFQWSMALEDVHMNIEARLTEGAALPGSLTTLDARRRSHPTGVFHIPVARA